MHEQRKARWLVDRFLRNVSASPLRSAVSALCACRAFDYQLYRLLANACDFTADRDTYLALTRLSFVARHYAAEPVGDWRTRHYRIHGVIRRLARESGEELIADGGGLYVDDLLPKRVAEADAVLERY